MNRLAFNCEVLTPLFLGGAETRVHPEVRAPSIRGAMRYWYRAIVGGSTFASDDAEKHLKQLRELESDVFGTTEQGSAVTIRVCIDQPPDIETFRKDRAIRTPEGDFLPTGKDYLLWSMAASGQPGTPRYQPDREYIKPGAQFTIRLQPRTPQDDTALNKAAAALWLLANLGGLGARANRGAGSLEVTRTDSVAGLDFKCCPSIDELCNHLSSGIRRCNHLVNGVETWHDVTTLPEYDILAPTVAEVWVVSTRSNGWASFSDALNGIGEKLRDYRSHRSRLGQADHDAVLDWLEGRIRGPQIKRAVFGLPIPFRYSEGGPSDVIIPEQGERRASPLRIRVTRLATGKYVGVLTLFKSRFLEEGKGLQLQTRKWKAPAPNDYKVIEDFIQTFEVNRRVNL
ncbi:MAG: type III-B CRISPR module RAMP protein Cmr1 [Anaerolineae bacterium]|nr:type III-B CRISPR module RAMP protein Cmr1 [Anaerolineae bacterium]